MRHSVTIERVRVCELKLGDEFEMGSNELWRVVEVTGGEIFFKWVDRHRIIGHCNGNKRAFGRASSQWVNLIKRKSDE